ncbi:metalloprotease PmbA [Arhodomonas sp. SL1]|uniref:metalloprotease PmbA n=1 Tax=Arhodomonas sp. SL1 TaxID=3425691 RepID=UPI003F884B82
MSGNDDTRALPAVAELSALVEQALADARQRGASAAEVSASASQGLSVKVRQGEVDTLEHMRDRGLAVGVYFGQRKGEASSSDYSPAAIREAVTAACEIARHTSEDPCSGLADAELMAGEVPDLDLYHPWGISAEDAIALARETEAAALAVDPRLTNSEGAEVSAGEGVRVYGNSHGFIGGFPASQHALSCVVLGREGDAMQRDFWYTAARAPEWLQAAAEVGREAGRRTAARLGARRLSTREVPVIFDPATARGLIGHFVGAVSGGSLYRRASFLVDHLDRPVFPAGFSIREEPHIPGALGSAPFDAEGVATRQRELVTDGVLRSYVLSSYSARKLGMQTTGNAGGVHNLTVAPGEKALEELIAEVGEGLLVTQLMGQGVNTVTGDYSRGASGFWIEGGEIAYPVEEITIAGNLAEMFRRITAVGRDVDTRGSIRTGSLVVEGMTVAGE